MGLDLSSLETGRSRWIDLHDALEGFRIEIKYRTMKERERFDNQMVRDGIFAKDGSINPGRMSSAVAAFAKQVIIGWEVPERFRSADTKDTNPPYSPDEFAKLLDAAPKSIEHIVEELKLEIEFFFQKGNGSFV